MQHKNRHGTHQETHIGKWKMDRLGLLSGSVQRHRPEEHDQINWQYLLLSAAPVMGVPCVGVERDFLNKDGMAIYTYSYEGATREFAFSDEHIAFELDMTMSEEPIETHPNFAAIKRKYGWNPLKRTFPEFMPQSSGGNGGLSGNKKGKKNELLGTDGYLSVGAVFRKVYVRREIPNQILRGIGSVVDRPPGIEAFNIPGVARSRNWLKLAPKISKRGNAVHIAEEWMLSGPRGWNKDIYGISQIEEQD